MLKYLVLSRKTENMFELRFTQCWAENSNMLSKIEKEFQKKNVVLNLENLVFVPNTKATGEGRAIKNIFWKPKTIHSFPWKLQCYLTI